MVPKVVAKIEEGIRIHSLQLLVSVAAQAALSRRAIVRMLAISRSMNSIDSPPGTSAKSCCPEEVFVAGTAVSVACSKFEAVHVDLLSWEGEALCCCVGVGVEAEAEAEPCEEN
jgi:hypothetical protein